MHVITISGKALAGKSTTAEMLKDELENKYYKDCLITHYGDLVKYTAKTFLGWDGQKDKRGRSLLQRVGTEDIRSKYPNYWVDYVITMVTTLCSDYDYVLIPDCRFSSEIERWKELIEYKNGDIQLTTVRINRPYFQNGLTLEQQQHESETALDNYDFDYYFNNCDSLRYLRSVVDMWIENYLMNR